MSIRSLIYVISILYVSQLICASGGYAGELTLPLSQTAQADAALGELCKIFLGGISNTHIPAFPVGIKIRGPGERRDRIRTAQFEPAPSDSFLGQKTIEIPVTFDLRETIFDPDEPVSAEISNISIGTIVKRVFEIQGSGGQRKIELEESYEVWTDKRIYPEKTYRLIVNTRLTDGDRRTSVTRLDEHSFQVKKFVFRNGDFVMQEAGTIFIDEDGPWIVEVNTNVSGTEASIVTSDGKLTTFDLEVNLQKKHPWYYVPTLQVKGAPWQEDADGGANRVLVNLKGETPQLR